MFDINQFKRQVKDWIRLNPSAAEQDLVDFCEEIIPTNQFAANQWLIEQTVGWYRHIISNRDYSSDDFDRELDD